jgi:hypothetical protein
MISQIYFWNKILHGSDSYSENHQEFITVHTAIGICHMGLLTASSVLILLVSCHQTCMTYSYCCVYSKKIPMMGRGNVRNM